MRYSYGCYVSHFAAYVDLIFHYPQVFTKLLVVLFVLTSYFTPTDFCKMFVLIFISFLFFLVISLNLSLVTKKTSGMLLFLFLNNIVNIFFPFRSFRFLHLFLKFGILKLYYLIVTNYYLLTIFLLNSNYVMYYD